MINKLLVAFFVILIVTTNAGCFGKSSLVSEVVYPSSIKKYAKNPSLTEAPLHTGQNISISTKKGISVNDTKEYFVNMVVTDFDTEKIVGNLLIISNGNRIKTTNDVVEVRLEDIDFVSVWKRKAEKKDVSVPALPESAAKKQSDSLESDHKMNTISHTIESDQIREIVDYPARSKIPLEAGDEIIINTNKKITVSSWNVDLVSLIVEYADTASVKGNLVFICCDPGLVREEIAGNIVNLKLEDIVKIHVLEYRQNPYSSSGDAVFLILCILTMGLFCPR